MKTLLLLGLAAFAVATYRIPNPRWLEEIIPERKVQDTEFRSGRQYDFQYDGQLLSGVPGSSKQHSATRMQAVCSLVFKTETQCLLKIRQIRMGKLNERVSQPRKMVPFSAFQEVPIEPELLEQLTASVKFTYEQGLINNIVFDGVEQPWSANIKRGILNLLQVNLSQRGRTDRSDDATTRNEIGEPENPKYDFFTAIEKTLEGECEMDYSVSSQPHRRWNQGKPVMNVTKSVNFEKCRRRPEIKYNYRFSTPCPTCYKRYNNEEKMLQSSTVTKLHIRGNTQKFLIEKSVCESQYIYMPTTEKSNVISSYVKQVLQLVRSSEQSNEVNEPSNPQPSDSQMIYTPDWDVLKERFFQEGENMFHDKTPYSAIKNKIEFVDQVVRKLARCVSESVEECAPRQFTRLVKILRMCKKNELEEIHNQFYKSTPGSLTPEDHKKIKDLLVDAIAVAGTKDCINHLVQKIKSRDIHPIKAALSIKNLINVRVPSTKMLEKLEQLAQDDVCKRNLFLKQSVYLTYGSLVNALCGDHEDKLAIELKKTQTERRCSQTYKEELVQKMFSKFHEVDTTPEKVLLLKTISNAGLDLSVFKLEKIIKNTGSQAPYKTLVRTEAVLALRRLRGTMPRKIQKILMPVFMNERELPDLRMVCAYQIMETMPERSVLDQITRQMFKERSRQVRSFVLSHLRTLSESTNPCEKRVADDLKLSLRRVQKHFEQHSRYYSKFVNMRTYSHKFDHDLGLNLGMVVSNYSAVPRYIAAGINLNSHGQWLKNLFTVGIAQHGSKQWIRQLYGKQGVYERGFDEVLRRSPRSIKTTSPQNELKKLFEKMKISNSYYTQQSNPIFMPYMKFKDQEIGFLPISPESVPESVRDIIKNDQLDLGSIERAIEQGIQMDFYQAFMLHEQSRKIPTTLGMPIRLTLKMPVVSRLSGQIKGKMEPKDKLRLVRLDFNIKPSMATTAQSKVECWSPIVNSGIKIIGNLKMFVPLNCETEVDARKTPVQTKLSCKPRQNSYELLKAQTKPISYTYVWPKSLQTWQEPEERTIVGEQWDRVNTWNTEFGEKSLGINFKVNGKWHRTPKESVTGTPVCPFSGPNKLRVIVEPGHQQPKEVTVRLTGKLFETTKKSLTPDFEFDKSEKSYFRSSEEKSSESDDDDYKKFKTSEPVNNQVHIKVSTSGSSVKRTAELKLNCHSSDRQRHVRCVTEIKRSPIPERESSPWKMRLETETFYPETPYRLSELTQQDKRFLSQIKANWGNEQGEQKEIDMKIQGKQSDEQIQYMIRKEQRSRFDSECSSPVCQYEQLRRLAVLTQYKIDVDYKLGKQEKELINKLYRTLKHWYFMQTSVEQIQVQNPDNQIRSLITIDPRNLQTVNVTIMTPRETAKIYDMPLSRPVRPINLRSGSSRVRSFGELVQKYIEPTMSQCQVRPRSVRTFDGVRMRVPYSQCYSVLAKDCSRPENPRFAVLVKKINDVQKQLKVISRDNRVVLKQKDNGKIEVDINGDKKNCPEYQEIEKHGHVVLRIQNQGPYCKVSLPEEGIKVYFDGVAANIKMSQLTSSYQCGLCGSFNGNEDDDLQTPEMRQVGVSEFHRSWLLQDQCQPEEQLSDESQYETQYSTDYQPQKYNYDFDEDWRSSKSGSCPRIRDLDVVLEQLKEECDSDSDCQGDKKCCFNGISHTCVQKTESRRGSQQQSRRNRSPVLRTKTIEHSHELCFSKEPTPRCPTDTYPIEHQSEQKVVYACLPRSDSQAERLHERALRGEIIDEVKALPSSFVQKEPIPQLCTKY